MDYYRSNIAGGGGSIMPSNANDTNQTILNVASDSYASNYWNIPYSDGLSPMKQIEGKHDSERIFGCSTKETDKKEKRINSLQSLSKNEEYIFENNCTPI